jgi:hypothetical protein
VVVILTLVGGVAGFNGSVDVGAAILTLDTLAFELE